MTFLVSPTRVQHGANRTQNIHDIAHDAPVLHVAYIELTALLLIEVITAGHLPGASDARLDQQSRRIDRIVFGHFERALRARTHHTHRTREHVEELR